MSRSSVIHCRLNTHPFLHRSREENATGSKRDVIFSLWAFACIPFWSCRCSCSVYREVGGNLMGKKRAVSEGEREIRRQRRTVKQTSRNWRQRELVAHQLCKFMHPELWQLNGPYTLPSMPCFHLEMQHTSLVTVVCVCVWTSACTMMQIHCAPWPSGITRLTVCPYRYLHVRLSNCLFIYLFPHMVPIPELFPLVPSGNCACPPMH